MLPEPTRTELALEGKWPVEVAAEYFDIPVEEARRLSGANGPTLDRFLLEQRLAYDERVGLNALALTFGVQTSDLERAMRTPPNGSAAFPLDVYGSDGRFLLPSKLAAAWVKELLPKHRVWSSLAARARDLAKAINGSVRECAVSKRFSESPADVATCRCVVTWDDVSRAHQEYLANGKPFPLEPDHVGWHAISDGKVQRAQLMRSDLANMDRYVAQNAA